LKFIIMNASLLVPSRTTSLPSRVTVDWRRFSSGRWRLSDGDVQAAFCADTPPNAKVFRHEGRLTVPLRGTIWSILRSICDHFKPFFTVFNPAHHFNKRSADVEVRQVVNFHPRWAFVAAT